MRQAAVLGVGYGRTRGADLVTPFHGVRASAGMPIPTTPEGRLAHAARLYIPRMLPGQFFCGQTALALHGLPVPSPIRRSDANGAAVHVGVRAPRTPPRARGVSGHRITLADVEVIGGASVCSGLQAWAQCAAAATLDELVIIGDALVRRVAPLATMAELEDIVESWRGKRGSRALGHAMTLIRPRTDSPAETRVRLILVRAGFAEPTVNFAIRDPRGRFLGFGDLAYPDAKIVLEYEGGHHFEEQQAYHDIDRLARFTAAGWLVVRLHKYHLRDRKSLCRVVGAAIVVRGAATLLPGARRRAMEERAVRA